MIASPSCLGGARAATALPEIAAAVLRRVDAESAVLRDAVWRDRDVDLAWIEEDLARRFERALRGTEPTEADLARYADHVRTAITRGATLPELQEFLRSSLAHSLAELWARAEPEDVGRMLRLSAWTARHNRRVERLLVTVYCERLDPARVAAKRREGLARRLLRGVVDDGDPPPGNDWLVVVLGTEGEPSRDAGRRDGPRGALPATSLEGHPHLLVPVAATLGRRRVWDDVAGWVQPRGLRAAAVFCDAAGGIPEAAAAARRLVRVTVAVGLPAGLVGPRELLLESALTAHPQGSAILAALLDGVASDERLMQTLVAFFASDLERTRTADRLCLSRGGLTRRLDRITVLTGVDPRTTRGVQVLGSALAARALRDNSGSG